ncbi:ATP-binding protein [Rhizobium phaseoli]|uniref:ATP-binding protein n=1 Tax=Rhizobium phaseoli TaxID=396 RepID=UPI00037E0741|nr:ATP-binding protein [Rhizobium phaseoli]KKZ86589.1 putative AAA domain-containing ATPase [Rhizobium phaseoli Ch24-10]
MELVRDKGEIGARITAMRILTPLAEDVFQELDALRACKRNAKAGEEQPAGCLFAESQYGKSEAIKMYIETRVVDDCFARGLFPMTTSRERATELQKLVLHVSLPENTRIKSMMMWLLVALNDPQPARGTVEQQVHRAHKLMQLHRTELIVFDEVNHLRTPKNIAASTKDDAHSVHNHLKGLLIRGYPIMFVGIPEAEEKLFQERQIKRRMMHRVEPRVLEYRDDVQKAIFHDFCSDLSISLVEKGITEEFSNFISDDILAGLFEASGGLLGGVVRIVWKASELAFLDRSRRVERDHLSKAVSRIAVGVFCDENPFVSATTNHREVRL